MTEAAAPLEKPSTLVPVPESVVSEPEPAPILFRNYVPKSKDLRQYCISRITLEDLETQLDEDMRSAIEASLSQDVLAQVNPKKPNWDLKRDIQKKLQMLSRQTNASILQLIQMNVEATKDSTIQEAAEAAAVAAYALNSDSNKFMDEDSDGDDE